MEHIRRTERLAVISQILLTNPNRLYNLNEFGQMLNAAKSSISEDIELLAEACEKYGVGAVETIPGAAGGVRYRPRVSKERAVQIVSSVAKKLSEPGRLLPGSFLYSSDVASDPEITRQLASASCEAERQRPQKSSPSTFFGTSAP
jgi:purine operon repressor